MTGREPTSRRVAVLGENYRTLLEGPCRRQGILPVFLPPCGQVDPRVAGHADLMVQPLGSGLWVAEPGSFEAARQALEPLGQQVLCGRTSPADLYPGEAAYDGLLLGGRLFHNPACTDPAILEQLKQLGIPLIPVRQGYASCSCAPVGEKGAITADPGMARALEQHGVKVLGISPGGILLPGYDTGLIGGACLSFGDGVLYSTGRLDHLPDYRAILCFLEQEGVNLVELTQGPAFDCGARTLQSWF